MNELKSLIVDATPKTPQIDLDQLTGDLIFSGRSIPENAAKVYEPVFDWVTQYVKIARPTTHLRLNLEYFNTASAIWLVKIFKVLLGIKEPEYVLIIHLYVPMEEYEQMNDFEDIKDAFGPLENLVSNASYNIGITLHGLDEKGEIVKETLVFL